MEVLPKTILNTFSKFKDLLKPPEPLFNFEDDLKDEKLVITTYDGISRPNIEHIDGEMSNNKGAPIHDPIYARKLSKWFIARASKEVSLKQSDEFYSSDAVNMTEGDDFCMEEKLSEYNIYDSVEISLPEIPVLDQVSDKSSDVPDISMTQKIKSSSLRFDSLFESGNLSKATRVYGRKDLVNQRCLDHMKDYVIPDEVDQEYDLTLQRDINTYGNIQWYYFSACLDESQSDTIAFPLKIRFNIINMQKSDALYNYGMKPLMYSVKDSVSSNLGWVHGGYDICYYKNGLTEVKNANSSKKKKKIANKYSLSFTFMLNKPDRIYFAHSYPYTYTKLQTYLSDLSKVDKISSFYRRRQLCKTICGNRCDLITITSPTEDANELKERKAIIISARIHPGETNSSFMMQGIIDFLIADTPEAELLRKLYVFKLVPMLNPDGVVHGNYRCSIAGTDLNRRYIDTQRDLHPEVSALKELIADTKDTRGVLMYLDLHGHSRNKNAFVYGCDYFMQPENFMDNSNRIWEDEKISRKIFPRIFPKLLNTISNPSNGGYFEFKDCSFKVQKSKLGTGRVVSWMKLEIEGSYTVELSFCGNGNNAESKLLKKAFKNSNFEINIGTIKSSDSFDKNKLIGSNDDLSVLNNEIYNNNDDGFADDEKDACNFKDSNKELHDLIESYKTAKHYTHLDFQYMGRDLCRALIHFSNITSISQMNSYLLQSNNYQSSLPKPPRDAHDFINSTMSRRRIELLDTYHPNQPLFYPSVYSIEALQSVLCESSKIKKSPDANNSNLNSTPDVEPAYGYRIYTEIALRKMMGLDEKSLEIKGFPEQEKYLENENNDNGSDSDPSGDNLPVETMMKRKDLLQNKIDIISAPVMTPKKKVVKSPAVAKSQVIIKENKPSMPANNSVKRNKINRISMDVARRKRDRNFGDLFMLGTGSTQRFTVSRRFDDSDTQDSNPKQIKVKSIIFNPDPPKVNDIQVNAPSSSTRASVFGQEVKHKRMHPDDLIEDFTKQVKIVSGHDSNLTIMDSNLKSISDRYRMRPINTTNNRSFIRKMSSNSESIESKYHVPVISENMQHELDNLALGMKSRSAKL